MIEILMKWRVALMMYHDLGEVTNLTGAEVRMVEHVLKQLASAASDHAARADPDVCGQAQAGFGGGVMFALLVQTWAMNAMAKAQSFRGICDWFLFLS